MRAVQVSKSCASNFCAEYANDSKASHDSNTNKTLLPGCGRPLNYIPKESNPDYIGRLFKNALSGRDIASANIA